jgi:pimeloyl-ACP methyl ester carboxylesterase
VTRRKNAARGTLPAGVPEIHEIEWTGGIVAALDWGGHGRPVVLLHPNGFCGGLYEPIATALAGRDARPVAIDLPGHGRSSSPPERAGLHFDAMADAVLAVLDALGIERAAAVGGSLGGGVAILADRARPHVWERLLLAEAVAFPPAAAGPGPGPNPMAEAARRRRRVFSDRPSMVAAYGRRAPLSELAPEALDAYVRWGTKEIADGVELRCDPEIEAAIFELSGTAAGAPDAWSHLADLTCPAAVVAGRSSFLPEVFEAQAERCDARFSIVEGGHFVLHEDTERGIELVRRYALEPEGVMP